MLFGVSVETVCVFRVFNVLNLAEQTQEVLLLFDLAICTLTLSQELS